MSEYAPTIGREIHPSTTSSLHSLGYGAGAELFI